MKYLCISCVEYVTYMKHIYECNAVIWEYRESCHTCEESLVHIYGGNYDIYECNAVV